VKTRGLKKTLSPCHFVHYKSHMDCPGREPRPAPETNRLSYGTANRFLSLLVTEDLQTRSLLLAGRIYLSFTLSQLLEGDNLMLFLLNYIVRPTSSLSSSSSPPTCILSFSSHKVRCLNFCVAVNWTLLLLLLLYERVSEYVLPIS
jgi:hypothetical protein